FCLAYSWISYAVFCLNRLLISWCAFFIVTFVLEQLSLSLLIAFIAVISTLAVSLQLSPRNHVQTDLPPKLRGEVWLRIVRASAFVLTLTGIAGLLGPQLSGLLTPFPIYATILGTFTHHFQGTEAASRLLRGVLIGTFTFAV